MFSSDVIVDASMPAMIRTRTDVHSKGNPRYRSHDTDRCYAGVYTATIDFVKTWCF
jgi:isocitrate dehydrogenase